MTNIERGYYEERLCNEVLRDFVRGLAALGPWCNACATFFFYTLYCDRLKVVVPVCHQNMCGAPS